MESKQYTAQTVLDYLARLNGGLSREEGLRIGLSNKPVKKVLVCWMSDLPAIDYAIQNGVDLMVVHESLFYPYEVQENGGAGTYMTWRANYERLRLLTQSGIAVIRMHYTLDKVCILDDFADALGLGAPVVSEGDFFKLYDIPPTTYENLIAYVKQKTDMTTLRASAADPGKIVRRVGLPWGGMGLFVNVSYYAKLVDLGCDALIAGETDNYAFRFANDSGVPMIETGHDISENPGLKHFAGRMAEDFPALNVLFYENKPPFAFV